MSTNTLKDYARQISSGYSGIISRLQNKYDAMMGALDEEYLARNREINKQTAKAKNEASASHKIDLANSRRSLLDRGLAGSGESVNTEIRSNLSKNQAFAALDAEAERARVENALNRSTKKSEIISARLDAEAEIESEKLKKAIEQMNDDRDREEDTRRWEIENTQKTKEANRDFYLDERKFASSEAQRSFENEMEKKKFESSEEQRKIENALDEKKYSLSAYDIYAKHSDDDEDEKKTEDKTEQENNDTAETDGGEVTGNSVLPEYTADELVNKMYKVYYSQYEDESDIKNALKLAIKTILEDESIDSAYREQIRVYASALGYI